MARYCMIEGGPPTQRRSKVFARVERESSEMASQLGKRSRQRSKKYYGAKRQRYGGLEDLSAGMQGVLITTSDQEKLCVSEAYSLLNEYADQLYGPEHLSSPEDSDADESQDGGSVSVDVEAEVAREIERLKGAKGKDGKRQRRRFQVVSTGAKHVVFIRCEEEVDPCQLVHHMLSDIATTGVRKSRFCQRILPVTKVCHASVKDIQRQADSVLQPHFHMDSLVIHKFAVNYKARNNNGVNRDEIIKLVAGMVVKNGDFDHQVDLNNPDLTIVVEIIKNICCLSVIKDFAKLKKYNLQSLVPPEAQKSSKTNTTSSEKATAKMTENATRKTDQTTVSATDTTDDKDTGDKFDSSDQDNQTTVSTADMSDRRDTADKTDTGDRATAIKISDTASDKPKVISSIADDGDKAAGETKVVESTEYSGAELSRNPISTETSSATEAGESRIMVQDIGMHTHIFID